MRKKSVHGVRHGKSEVQTIITYHLTHGKDARKRLMNQEFLKFVFLTSSLKDATDR